MSTLMLLTLLFVSNGKWPSAEASTSSGYVQLDVPMRNLTRYEGETVRIRCEITGFPLPGYRWYHDDQLIRPDPLPPPTPSSAISSAQLAASNPSTAGADGPRRDSRTTPWGSRLKIDELTVKDSGYYMCEGFNVYGHQKTVGYLQVLPGPNPNPPHRPSNPDQSRPGESDIDDVPGSDGGGLGSYYEGGAGDDAGYTDSQEGGGSRDGRPRDVDDDGWQRPATATGSGPAAPGSGGGGGGMDSSKRALSVPENFATTISLSSSCQEYRGLVCSSILSRKYVNIPTPSYQAEREEKLIATFTTIATSNDFNPQCGETAMSLLCHYAFKPCGENNGDVFGQGHRVQVCKDFCETLQKDTCRSAQNLVRQHLQREYQLAPPRCDARSEMCDFGDQLDFQSTTDVHVRSTTDSSSMTAYIVAACVGAALAVVIIFLVARRCRPQYRPVTNRKQPTSAATSAVASSASNKFSASKPIVSVAAKQANLSSQQLQFSGNKMAEYGYQVRQQQLMQEQCVMLLPGATSTLQRPGGHAGLMPTTAFSGVASLPVVASIAEVHPSNVRLVQRIGEGSFGTVYVGEVAASLIGQISTVTSSMRPVIVKTLSNSGLTGIDYSYFRTYFIERALSTAVLHHPNLLSVVGGCIQSVSPSGTISLLFEHYGGIDLDSFVRGRFGTTSGLTVFRLAEGISAGMEYATSRGWVHGDLTVHNVLVVGCGVADGFSTFQQVKVTDLGMTSSWSTTVGQPALQNGAAEHHHRSSSFPVSRQTAPEVAVYGHLAAGEASDVWSFGVLLWEIYSMRTAAEAVSDSTGSGSGDVDVISGSGAATSDRDMLFVCPGTLPIRCPTSMATLMSDCWNEVPDQRPTFATVHGMLINILERLDSQHHPFAVSTDVSSPLTATTGNSSSSPATSNETACTMLTDAHHRQQLLAAEVEGDLHRHSTSVEGHQATPLLQSYRHFQRRPWPAMGSDLVQTGASSDHEMMHQVGTQYPAFRGGYWSGSDNNSATHGGGGSSLGAAGVYEFGGRPCPTPATTIDRSPSYICRLHENFSNVV